MATLTASSLTEDNRMGVAEATKRPGEGEGRSTSSAAALLMRRSACTQRGWPASATFEKTVMSL